MAPNASGAPQATVGRPYKWGFITTSTAGNGALPRRRSLARSAMAMMAAFTGPVVMDGMMEASQT